MEGRNTLYNLTSVPKRETDELLGSVIHTTTTTATVIDRGAEIQ